ncbi:RNA polymerase sigma factor [Pedobacter puniceum]|jgi:RNA polymerase sigma-70 factor (ECF subfamily)|uniref:Sigma-70 family RNA polymerase sigma factor n=1 Tax=Pedobacter puniceum TaxID=2666136 RepID=A0A7K0FNH4_9SPHI|nr:sigma-70 family RNA polymerase sigma factor [Pedobacter puniceum]MRX47538.1 sigma-70 family RNA polymerase sigma factor [Pedobacter puniceum]
MQQELTDIAIIDAVLAGDQQAYALLVKRYQRYVFTLALRFTKGREDAEEVAQDCFVKAFKYLAGYERKGKFTTWLYSIVYTTAMTYLRKKQVDILSIDDENHQNVLDSHEATPDLNTERKSRDYYLNLAIESLLPDDASIITLFYKGEQSLEEIAQIMGIEANTAKVKLHRARGRLKIKLEQLLKSEAEDLI